MATTEFTSSADLEQRYLEKLDLHALQRRLDYQTRQDGVLKDSIDMTRAQIDAVRPKLPEAVRFERDLDTMLADESYDNDYNFEPTNLDVRRFQNTELEEQILDDTATTIKTLADRIEELQKLPERVETLRSSIEKQQKTLDTLNSGFFSRYWNGSKIKLMSNRLESDCASLSALQKELPNREQNIESARSQQSSVEDKLGQMEKTRDRRYIASLLHDERPAVGFSPRTNQAILVDFDGSDTIMLRMPRTPGEVDCPRELTLVITEYDKMKKFVQMLGENVPTPGYLYTIGESVTQYNKKFSNIFVPFALEIVEVDGKQEYRLPQAVWNEFGDFLVLA